MHLALEMMRAAIFGAALIATSAHAQTYPERPIRLLIGFAPGSSADVAARIVADQMTKSLGQPVVVDRAAIGCRRPRLLPLREGLTHVHAAQPTPAR